MDFELGHTFDSSHSFKLKNLANMENQKLAKYLIRILDTTKNEKHTKQYEIHTKNIRKTIRNTKYEIKSM